MAAVVIDCKDKSILPFSEKDGVEVYYGRFYREGLPFVAEKMTKDGHFCWVFRDNVNVKRIVEKYHLLKL